MSVNASTVAEAKRVAKDFVALCDRWEREDKKEQASRDAWLKRGKTGAWFESKPVGIAASLKRRSHDLRVVLAELRRS